MAYAFRKSFNLFLRVYQVEQLKKSEASKKIETELGWI